MANEFGLFWDSINHDRLYNAASFEEWLRKFFTTGVFEGECVVTANGGMNLAVSAGYSNLDGKVKFFDTPTYLSLSPAHGQYPRIDTVVIERNDTDREITMKVVTGTYSGTNPVAPAPVRENGIYQIVLAQIRVNAGATEITPINITDTRPNKNLCGIVAGTVEEINFESIQNQFNDWFEHYREELETDPAAHLQNQVDDLRATKQDNVTGAATTILDNNLTANRALVSNSSGKVGVSGTITATELGYLDGVTSSVQNQLNAKIPYKAFEVQPNTTDFNTLIPSGADTFRFDRVNVPEGAYQNQPQYFATSKNWSIITFSTISTNYIHQFAFTTANSREYMFERVCIGGTWKSWSSIRPDDYVSQDQNDREWLAHDFDTIPDRKLTSILYQATITVEANSAKTLKASELNNQTAGIGGTYSNIWVCQYQDTGGAMVHYDTTAVAIRRCSTNNQNVFLTGYNLNASGTQNFITVRNVSNSQVTCTLNLEVVYAGAYTTNIS